MKNIAVPLLLAGSARAQGKKAQMMADYAVPKPILIADTWNDGSCTNTAVATALTNLTGKQAELTPIQTENTTLAEAVTTAATAKDTAVADVIAKDAEIATNLATDDAAQQLELTKNIALGQATFEKGVAQTAATAALNAKTAADTAKTAGDTLKTAMDTASTNAASHYTAEQGQTAALTTAESTAQGAYTTLNNEIAGLTTLYTTAKATSDTDATTLATKLAAKTAAAALLAKLTTANSTAQAALNSATDPSPAKDKLDADNAMGSILTTLNTKGTTNWVPLAQTTTEKYKPWIVGTEVYNALTTGNDCNGTAQTATTETDVAACKALCDALPAWGMASNLPTGGSAPDGSNSGSATHCYGITFKTSGTKCALYPATVVTAASGSAQAETTCYIRNKTVVAPALVTALAASATTQTQWTEFDTALTAWGNQSALIDIAAQKVAVATDMAGKLSTAKTNADNDSTTKAGEWTTANNTWTGTSATTTTKKGNLDTKQAAVDAAQAALTAATSAKTIQIAEEAAQLAIKTLAEGDVTAQATVVTTLTTAASTADTAKTAADSALTAATSVETTAQTEFTNAQTAANTSNAGMAANITALNTLRATAATATTDLGTATTALATNQTSLTAKQGEIATASATHLAAVVACKEAAFDSYAAALATAQATRSTNITTIEGLIDAAAAAKPTAGSAGARCEKALSNGTFRPKRDEAVCAENLCCAAAKIPVGKAVMIIETCQSSATPTGNYSYAPPRAPMATTMPTGTDYPYTCIQGAQKLAAAASALVAAVYMLA